ncbi:hypothetical protein VB773_18100 [Haloarculaceae archaeon H-GB2-1]|nr:hypothetical protein [Haloarculaceae archaeon H-GB2-1]
MARPSQLLLILIVYLLGATIAAANGATLAPRRLVAGATALLPLAASVHYANEFADHETDARTDRTPFSGGSGALAATGFDPTFALRAAQTALLVGIATTTLLFTLTSLPATSVGVLALITAFGWQYSLGPLALAWRGWANSTTPLSAASYSPSTVPASSMTHS